MEKQLAENEEAESREVEVKRSNGQGHKSVKTNKAIKKQTMGNCERCGYMSSQRFCKACMLLDGLNRNRPKTAIEVNVGMEEEEGSTTLMRQMERTQLTNS